MQTGSEQYKNQFKQANTARVMQQNRRSTKKHVATVQTGMTCTKATASTAGVKFHRKST